LPQKWHKELDILIKIKVLACKKRLGIFMQNDRFSQFKNFLATHMMPNSKSFIFCGYRRRSALVSSAAERAFSVTR
jgi:uncharacterized CHY-type Zn-finger protein